MKRIYAGGSLKIGIPERLRKIARELGNTALSELEERVFSVNESQAFFLPTITKISAMISSFKDTYDYIFLTGGFANNPFLQLEMLKRFDKEQYDDIHQQPVTKTDPDWMRPWLTGVVRVTRFAEQSVCKLSLLQCLPSLRL